MEDKAILSKHFRFILVSDLDWTMVRSPRSSNLITDLSYAPLLREDMLAIEHCALHTATRWFNGIGHGASP